MRTASEKVARRMELEALCRAGCRCDGVDMATSAELELASVEVEIAEAHRAADVLDSEDPRVQPRRGHEAAALLRDRINDLRADVVILLDIMNRNRHHTLETGPGVSTDPSGPDWESLGERDPGYALALEAAASKARIRNLGRTFSAVRCVSDRDERGISSLLEGRLENDLYSEVRRLKDFKAAIGMLEEQCARK